MKSVQKQSNYFEYQEQLYMPSISNNTKVSDLSILSIIFITNPLTNCIFTVETNEFESKFYLCSKHHLTGNTFSFFTVFFKYIVDSNTYLMDLSLLP